ncbi:MAG: radical SAM protein [bacterium]
MQYDLPLWRPPSEARSLILQVTLGCSHNECTFCHMYVGKKFRARPWNEVERDIASAARQFPTSRRVFLADGDPLAVGAPRLQQVAETLWRSFPKLQRISTYATPQNLLRKSPAQLERIRQSGLELLYFGVESGDPQVLETVHKGATREQIIEAADRAHAAGFKLSCTVLLGLAGREGSLRHARETASLLSRIDPAYASALSIMIPEADEYRDYPLRPVGTETPWRELGPMELVRELRELVAGLNCRRTTFRSNHASNYLPIGGDLPEDKPALLRLIDKVLESADEELLRPEWMRGL